MKYLLSLLLGLAVSAHAVEPAVITITKDPLTKVTVKRNTGNTGKSITVTGVNQQDTVVIKDLAPAIKEGQAFTIAGGTYNVAYGIDTRWTVKPLEPGVYTCGNQLFGDPAVGFVKTCKIGLLVVPPVIPPVPPVMHGGLPVDEKTIPPFQPGINTTLLSPPGTENPPARTDYWENDGKWRFVCNTIVFAFDDPIVYPGQPGVAHGHNFFGNGAANAFTTPANIRTGDKYSSCRGGTINLSLYWTPAMVDTRNNAYVVPKANLGYYSTGFWRYDNNNPPMNPMPKGLVMISGNPMATTAGGYAGSLSCLWVAKGYNRPGTETDGSIPTNCVPGEDELWAVLKFPQCWDGKNLDSPDHKSHVAFPVFNNTPTWVADRQYMCPTTHPKWIPELSYHVQYTIPSTDALKAWKFVSDMGKGGYGFHGDYMNGWDQPLMDQMTEFCLRGQRNCGTAILPDGSVTLEFQGN